VIETLKYWDRALFFVVNRVHSTFLDKVMWVISNDFFLYPFIILFLICSFKKLGGKRTAVFLLGIGLCVACADLSSNLVKHSVQRYRPSHNLQIKEQVHTVNDYIGGVYGFFSGHAANSFAVTTLLFLGSAAMFGKRERRMFFLLPLFISYSRIYLGVHYPSDILVGAIIGIFFGWLIHKILSNYFIKEQIQAE
jgi:undecaprenyl-diphosphatase